MAIIQGWPGNVRHCLWRADTAFGTMSLCLPVSASCSSWVGHCFILQARWVHFTETGSHPLLCLLQSTLLTIYTLEGEVHSVPLAYNFTEVWPLPRGLLLAVRHAALLKSFWCCFLLQVTWLVVYARQTCMVLSYVLSLKHRTKLCWCAGHLDPAQRRYILHLVSQTADTWCHLHHTIWWSMIFNDMIACRIHCSVGHACWHTL